MPGRSGSLATATLEPRTGSTTLDALSLTLKRIVYPVDAAQQRILSAGLPASLANRLAVGR